MAARVRLAVLLALPVAGALVPTSWLEAGPSLCLVSRVIRRPCPGCGMTRAVSRVLHADPRGALRYNRLVVLAFPLLAWIWAEAVVRASRPRA